MFNENKVYCGDSTNLLVLVDDKSIDHVLTSPPYNRKRNDKYSHLDDSLEDWVGFCSGVIDNLLRVTKGYVFFNVQKTYYNKKDVFELIGKYSDKIVEIIVWEKTNPNPASGLSVTNSYEFILVFSDKSLKGNSTYTKNTVKTSVYSGNPHREVHRAVMHPEIADWVISNFTKENEIVLDPFMGVGTTALSCLKNNRKFIGFEISPQYYSICTEEIENMEKRLALTPLVN